MKVEAITIALFLSHYINIRNMKNETKKTDKPCTIQNAVCSLSGKTIRIPTVETPCKSCKNDDGYLQCLNCKGYNQYQSESVWD